MAELGWKEKRKILRQLERLYKTDPEFKARVDAIVEERIETMHAQVYEESPLLMLGRIRQGEE